MAWERTTREREREIAERCVVESARKKKEGKGAKRDERQKSKGAAERMHVTRDRRQPPHRHEGANFDGAQMALHLHRLLERARHFGSDGGGGKGRLSGWRGRRAGVGAGEAHCETRGWRTHPFHPHPWQRRRPAAGAVGAVDARRLDNDARPSIVSWVGW